MAIIEEYLFGSAISSFECGLAWNGGQGGHLTATLVDDPSVGSSFVAPSVGTPIYFTYSNFPYGGIFRDYIKDLSSGGSIYRVTLSDVSEIVGNVQVIINGYTGYATVQNLLNVFGYLESSGFGDSGVIEAGMPYNNLISGLNYVANNTTNYGQPITYMGYTYYLNLDELPVNIPNYYINGDVINLLDLISQICSNNSLDFFFRLRRVDGRNVIYVKTISRTANAQPGRIAAFVAASTIGATATTIGVELRNETTAKVVLGDNVLDMRQFQCTFPSGYESSQASVTRTATSTKITFNPNYPKYYSFNTKYKPYDSNLFTGNVRVTLEDGRVTRPAYPLCFPHEKPIVEITDNEILPFFGTDIMGFQYVPIKAQEEKDFIDYMQQCFEGSSRNPLVGYIDRTPNGAGNDISKTDMMNVGKSVISSLVWYHENVFFESTIPNYPHFVTIGELKSTLEGEDSWHGYVDARCQMIKNASRYYSGFYSDDIIKRHTEIYMNLNVRVSGVIQAATRSDLYQFSGLYNIDTFNDTVSNALSDNPSARSVRDSTKRVFGNSANRDAAQRARNTKIYEGLYQLAQDCYGKKFVIRLRDVYVKLNEQLRPVYSDDPSNEGYTETEALGLNAFEQTFFKNQEGKLECFVEFDSVDFIDLTKLNTEDYFIKTPNDLKTGLAKTYTNKKDIDTLYWEGSFGPNARLYLRCTVEPYLLFGSYFISLIALGATTNSIDYDDARVVVNLSSPVFFRPNCRIDGARTISDERLSQPQYNPNKGFSMIDYGVKKRGRELTAIEEAKLKTMLNGVGGKNMAQQITPDVLIPRAVCYATKSNTRRYGPWQAQGAAGRVEFENDSNLNPWTFNGYSNMNLVGNAKAQGAVSNMQYTETGSVNIPGAPTLELGDFLINGGPPVTDISVSVTPQGVVSSYNMRSFIPSFGELSRRYQEQIRQNTQKTLINQKNEKITNRVFAGKVFSGNLNDTRKLDLKMGTPHEMLVSESIPYINYSSGILSTSGVYYDHEVFSETLVELRPELSNNYLQKAGMSLDGLFRPYVVNPYASNYANSSSGIPTLTVNPQQSGSFSLSPFGPIGSGHDITYVIRGREIPDDLDCKKGSYDPQNYYRALGLKLPLVAVGWGYDTDGNPVPAAASGTRLNPNGDRYEFAEDYLINPASWKAGPVDLRWDQEQAMWVPPGSTADVTSANIQIFRGIAENLIPPYGSGTVRLLSSSATTGVSGNPLVESWLGQPVCSGQKVLVAVDNGVVGGSGYLSAGSISPYYILSSEFSNLEVVRTLVCTSGTPVVQSATIYLPSAFSLTEANG